MADAVNWLVIVVIVVVVVPAALWWLDLDLFAAESPRATPDQPIRSGSARGMVVRSRATAGREIGQLRLTPDELVVTSASGSSTRIARTAIVASRRGELLEIDWGADGLTCQVDDVDSWVRDLCIAGPARPRS